METLLKMINYCDSFQEDFSQAMYLRILKMYKCIKSNEEIFFTCLSSSSASDLAE